MEWAFCDFSCIISIIKLLSSICLGLILLAGAVKFIFDYSINRNRKWYFSIAVIEAMMLTYYFELNAIAWIFYGGLCFVSLAYLLEKASLFFVADCPEAVGTFGRICLSTSAAIAALITLCAAIFGIAWVII